MVRPVRAIVIAVLLLVVAVAAAWSSLALWYRLPLPEVGRLAGAILFGLLGAWVIMALFGRRRLRAVLAFAAAFVLVLIWWGTVEPQANGVWAPDVAGQVTGEFDGDRLTLTNVRDFEWRSATDFAAIWRGLSKCVAFPEVRSHRWRTSSKAVLWLSSPQRKGM
ncbi:membrane associated rhomboid family serine protease [Rhizobium leguminosarum]|nr:membrane associated rhomboid family serine protease [Rhizobium leguminosarum]